MKKMKGMFSLAMLAIAFTSTGFVSYAQEKNADPSSKVTSLAAGVSETWVSQASAAQQKQAVYISVRCQIGEVFMGCIWAHASIPVESPIQVCIMSYGAEVSEWVTIMPGCQDSESVYRPNYNEDIVRDATVRLVTPTEDAKY